VASSKRERELARMRAERQSARRAAAEAARKARQRAILMTVAALAVVGVAVGVFLATQGDTKKPTSTLAQPTPTRSVAVTPAATTPADTGTGACTYAAAAAAAKPVSGKPPTTGIAKTTQKISLKTDQGMIALSLNGAKAPCTVNSFTFLTKQKYFDGTSCHRLTTSGIYVLQCGDPSGTGSGGPGYQYADENLKGVSLVPGTTSALYPRGTIAMANAGAGTNGSQFFLVYKDTQLPPSYTPFGTITAGLDILDKVAAKGSTPDGDGKPNLAVKIETATLLA
jgi:peptidyl-prolyl cis-trans isomerase B (cyclophilin B)